MRVKRVRFLICLVLAVFSISISSVLPASPEEAAVVAMITDLKGKATLANDVRKPELAILSEIKNKQRVQFQADARAVIVYLESGQEFEVKGPALIAFGMQQPESVSGNPPSKRGVALAKSGKNIRIKPVVVARASIVMRAVKPDEKIKLLSPSGGTTLDRHPSFEWQVPQSGLKYQFELLDDTGKPLFETLLEKARVELPDSVLLQESTIYTWVVSTTQPDGKQSSNAADFSIASEALRIEVQELQPAADAALSERVVFAAWLEQVQLHDEARKYWKQIAAERQDDKRLKVLADE